MQCDICGREMDDGRWTASDGLRICGDCEPRMGTEAVGEMGDDQGMVEELQALVGKSAGAICRTLEIRAEPPYDVVLEAAARIGYDQDRYMSAWLFAAQWQDGTTVWRSSDGKQTALVRVDGRVVIRDV